MDWWPFLTLRTRIGYGSLHSEHQNRSSNLRWWIRKCTALCSRPLNMLRSYILLFAVWCPLNLYALCSDMFSLLWLLRFAFQAWITIQLNWTLTLKNMSLHPRSWTMPSSQFVFRSLAHIFAAFVDGNSLWSRYRIYSNLQCPFPRRAPPPNHSFWRFDIRQCLICEHLLTVYEPRQFGVEWHLSRLHAINIASVIMQWSDFPLSPKVCWLNPFARLECSDIVDKSIQSMLHNTKIMASESICPLDWWLSSMGTIIWIWHVQMWSMESVAGILMEITELFLLLIWHMEVSSVMLWTPRRRCVAIKRQHKFFKFKTSSTVQSQS